MDAYAELKEQHKNNFQSDLGFEYRMEKNIGREVYERTVKNYSFKYHSAEFGVTHRLYLGWAAFLDAIGVKWEFSGKIPLWESFILPDFYHGATKTTGLSVYVLPDWDVKGERFLEFAKEEFGRLKLQVYAVSDLPDYHGNFGLEIEDFYLAYGYNPLFVDGKNNKHYPDIWTICPQCKKLGLGLFGYVNYMHCKCGAKEEVCNFWNPQIKAASLYGICVMKQFDSNFELAALAVENQLKAKFGGYETYQEYLQSDHWKQFAGEAKERAGKRCQLCNADGELHTHHRTYERLGEELPEDVVVLCSDCHAKFHDKAR